MRDITPNDNWKDIISQKMYHTIAKLTLIFFSYLYICGIESTKAVNIYLK